MAKQMYVCNKCGKCTPLLQKLDNLPNGVEHHYAECYPCGHRSTIFYTNPEIKALMYQQKNTAFFTKKKKRLTKKIQKMMDELRNKVEIGN